VGRQRIGLTPAVPSTALFQWMADLAFRLGNVPLLELPEEDFKEIAFYEFAAAPVYPEFEFQLVEETSESENPDEDPVVITKARLLLKISPYTMADLRRLERSRWSFLYND